MNESCFLTTTRLEKALEYLECKEDVVILAGGTDLLVAIHKGNFRLQSVGYLLDIRNIAGLRSINRENGYLNIGPLVTFTMLIEEPFVRANLPLLAEASQFIGSVQIRNQGTIGGNVCNASPAADLVPPLIALDSQVVLNSRSGTRMMAVDKFISGPYETCRCNNEVLTNIRIPLVKGKVFSNFQRVARRYGPAIARLSLVVLVELDEKGIIRRARVVPGAATPSPTRLVFVENEIIGSSLDGINLNGIQEMAGEELISISGERWSSPYKRPVIGTLIRRSLEIIRRKAEDGSK